MVISYDEVASCKAIGHIYKSDLIIVRASSQKYDIKCHGVCVMQLYQGGQIYVYGTSYLSYDIITDAINTLINTLGIQLRMEQVGEGTSWCLCKDGHHVQFHDGIEVFPEFEKNIPNEVMVNE